jgi:hypothetical protein
MLPQVGDILIDIYKPGKRYQVTRLFEHRSFTNLFVMKKLSVKGVPVGRPITIGYSKIDRFKRETPQ